MYKFIIKAKEWFIGMIILFIAHVTKMYQADDEVNT